MKKWLLLFLSCFIFLQAASEQSVFDSNEKLKEEVKRVYESIAPSDENTDFEEQISDPFMATSPLVLELMPYERNYLVGEVFSLSLRAITNEKTDFDFYIETLKNDALELLTPQAQWIKTNNTYTTTLYFQAKNSNASLEQITVKLSKNKHFFQESSLKLEPLYFKNIQANKNFSHIIADELHVKRVKTSYFDDKNIITMIELNASNANLNNFYIQDIQDQGVENIKGDFKNSSGFYFAILKANTKEFDFSYYNKTSQKFEEFKLALELSDEKISTQSDLNPQNNEFNLYKQVLLWILTALLVLAFLFKRNYWLLVLALSAFILSFFISSNSETAILKANSKASILPTPNSTYFYSNETQAKVEILSKRQNYVKVFFEDGTIGWVDEKALE